MTPLRPLLRGRLAPLCLVATALASACLQGARAPEVAPRGTLAPGEGDAAAASSDGAFGVVFASPKGDTVDPAEITVVWNRPVRALGPADQAPRPPITIKPEVKGHWVWVGTTGATFSPEGHLPGATAYTVEVPAGTKALDGSAMEKAFSLHFTTPRPRLLSARPTLGDHDAMEPGTKLELRFNQPIAEAVLVRDVHLVPSQKHETPVAFDLRRPDPKDERVFDLVPRAPLALDTGYTLQVDGSLQGKEGDLIAGELASQGFRTYGPLRVKGIECYRDGPHERCSNGSGATIELTNRVKVADLKKALRVEPAVKIQWAPWLTDEETTANVTVSARFAPGKTYRFSLASVKDVHGQPLAAPWSGPLAFDDLWPAAAIGVNGAYLEPGARRPIPVASVNVKELELATAPLDEEAVLALMGGENEGPRQPDIDLLRGLPGGKVLSLRPGGAVNTGATHNVDTEQVLGGKERRGPIGIALRYTTRPGTHQARTDDQGVVTQVTDLAISAKVSPHGSLVWVTKLSSGAPVEGASVTIRSKGSAPGTPFVTDKNGVAAVPESVFTPAYKSVERAVIFARTGGDWAYRPVGESLNGWRYGVSVDLGPDQPFGMLFSDRGIYRPGETVHVKGIFRREAARGTETPAGKMVDLVFTAPDGEVVQKQHVALSAFGTVSADLALPAAGRLGSYSVQATIEGTPRGYPDATTDVDVAEYRPAEFKVGVESDRPSYVRGDKAAWTARGDYLFGAPMSGASADLRVTRASTWFQPPGADGFAVDDDTYQSGRPEATEAAYEVQSSTAKLDAKGNARLEAALAMPGQHGPELVTAEANITDLSRQTISGSTSAVVHPAEIYLGLKAGADLFVKATDTLSPEVIAVEPRGTRLAGVAVTVDLVQRRWVVAKQKVGGGHRTTSTLEDKVVSSCSVTTAAGKGAPGCALKPSGVGYYIVRASAKDRRGNPVASSAPLYATGDTGDTSWGDSDWMHVDLVPDRKSYEIGQTAHVLVKSPFKSAEAWVTVERGGVYSQERRTLSGPMPTVDVPITADLRPNAFVSVLLVRGRTKAAPAKLGASDVGTPAFRAGYAALPVNPEARRLTVTLKPSRAEAHPGDPLEVDVDVKDKAGKPARAEITLYAVDEGVLSLVGYKTPDPIPVFGAPRSLKVATIESREAIARVENPFSILGLDKGLTGGGGGGKDASAVRKDFRASAYWNAALVTDAAGHAHAGFKLPDGLTTYRIMAIAAAEDDRFGFAEDRVVTSRPLMARPALPRFVRAGDTIDAGVVVTSKGLTGRTHVDVEIAAEGLTVTGDAKKSVDLDPRTSAEVRFALSATKAGPAKLSFRAGGGGAEDRVEVTREVKSPLVLEASALYGDTTHEAAEKLGDLSSIRDDVGGLDVSYASTALVGLGDGVEHLVQYPYGCTEQLVSRLVPLLPLRDLAADYQVPLPKDLDHVVAKTVADVLAHQRSDGGFGLWADSAESWPWVTAYALWGLGVAKDHQVAVPERALESAVRYLHAALSTLEKGSLGLATEPFVLDVLAERGRGDPGRTTKAFETREKMPLFARAELLHAMVIGKADPASIAKLVSEVEGGVRLDGSVARVTENLGSAFAPLMDSDTRTAALVLRGLLAARPDHPLAARLAMGLLADRKGGTWRNTQETAWALLALDAYRKAQEKTEPNFTAHVFLGQAEIASSPFQGRSLTAPHTSVPAARLVTVPGAPLGFTVEGQGRLFYEARLRYAKKTLPREGLDRGFFVKKTLRAVTPEALTEALRAPVEAGARAFRGSDLVLGEIVVVTPSPRHFVVLDDPLPAGFEAVDARLATTGASADVDRAAARAGDGDGGFQASAYVREVRDDRVLFFIDRLPAGMYRYRYLARATSLGSFVLPPTKVEEMYTPEVFGRTGAETITIDER